MHQLVTRVDDQLVAGIDQLIDGGVVANRSEAVRLALQRLIEAHRRDQVANKIVAGYRRLPQTETEIRWVDDATAAMIDDEPW